MGSGRRGELGALHSLFLVGAIAVGGGAGPLAPTEPGSPVLLGGEAQRGDPRGCPLVGTVTEGLKSKQRGGEGGVWGVGG